MKLANLLATRRGRLAAFTLLYVSEGIPLGFSAIAIATQMRRQGLEPAVIGAFVGSLYLPWAIKWAFGPFVDVLSVDRWGRRRGWILLTQTLMILSLLVAMTVNFQTSLALFTALIFVHNVFSATQDVAIDALAVDVLHEDERGLANGLMFGGQYLGQAIGGSGVLLLTPLLGFQSTFIAVAAAIAMVTMLVTIPMREIASRQRTQAAGSRLAAIVRELGRFVRDAGKAFVSSRAALVAVPFALLPMGAVSLGLALMSNLAVELGLDDRRIGLLTLGSTVLSGVFCVLGGWVSDRLGRRRTLAIFIAATVIPVFALALATRHFGWVLPVSPTLADRPVPPEGLVAAFWALVLLYAVFQGLMYGVGTAIFMDVTTARVAATQFTAYMAMSNFAISYSATWQGAALQRWGYPITLALDGLVGLVCLVGLALMGRLTSDRRRAAEPARAERPPVGAASDVSPVP